MKLKNNLSTLFYLGFDTCIFPGEDYELSAEQVELFGKNRTVLALVAQGKLELTQDPVKLDEAPAPVKAKRKKE